MNPNKPLQLTAKFNGAHGSNGYHRGHTYNITVKGSTVSSPGRPDTQYGSVEAFIRNWTNIKTS